jgi:hypothetical protein
MSLIHQLVKTIKARIIEVSVALIQTGEVIIQIGS